MNSAYFIIAGAVGMGHAIAALFFLRFWRTTRDRLFAAFAAAFALMSLQAFSAFLDIPKENQTPFYLLRLAAFLLIIAAIIGKNLGRRGGG